jgi:hypothetical protein
MIEHKNTYFFVSILLFTISIPMTLLIMNPIPMILPITNPITMILPIMNSTPIKVTDAHAYRCMLLRTHTCMSSCMPACMSAAHMHAFIHMHTYISYSPRCFCFADRSSEKLSFICGCCFAASRTSTQISRFNEVRSFSSAYSLGKTIPLIFHGNVCLCVCVCLFVCVCV